MTSNRPLLVFLLVLTLPGPALAQADAPPSGDRAERVGIGGMAAIGYPSALATVRFSAPLSPRLGLDLDVGRLAGSNGRGSRRATAALVRWLRRERTSRGASDYLILGVMHAKEIMRTEIRFPGRTFIEERPVSGLSAQVGYGWDQTIDGVRVAFELTSGGTEQTGPRMFARLAFVWGPAPR